jgi:hypothetical protein
MYCLKPAYDVNPTSIAGFLGVLEHRDFLSTNNLPQRFHDILRARTYLYCVD